MLTSAASEGRGREFESRRSANSKGSKTYLPPQKRPAEAVGSTRRLFAPCTFCRLSRRRLSGGCKAFVRDWAFNGRAGEA
jgi:hypothetical protein